MNNAEAPVRLGGRPPGLRLRPRPRRASWRRSSVASRSSEAVADASRRRSWPSTPTPTPSPTTSWTSTRSTSCMTGDGWAKNADGIWAKDGQQADIEFITTAGNKRRELTQQIVQQQAEGGRLRDHHQQPEGRRPSSVRPSRTGDYQMGLYAQVLTIARPEHCNLFCSKNIPSASQQLHRPELAPRRTSPSSTRSWRPSRRSLDEDERRRPARRPTTLLAENVVIAARSTRCPTSCCGATKIVGPVEDNPILGPFVHMHEWGLAG